MHREEQNVFLLDESNKRLQKEIHESTIGAQKTLGYLGVFVAVILGLMTVAVAIITDFTSDSTRIEGPITIATAVVPGSVQP